MNAIGSPVVVLPAASVAQQRHDEFRAPARPSPSKLAASAAGHGAGIDVGLGAGPPASRRATGAPSISSSVTRNAAAAVA